MWFKIFNLFLFIWIVLPFSVPTVSAQTVPGAPLDITADSLEYLTDQKLMIGKGNVEIRDGINILKADYMTVQTETMDVVAKGNVFYQSGTQTWRGEEFKYNMKSKKGDFGKFDAYYDPFYIKADESKRVSENETNLKKVTLTTCEGEDPAVSIRAKEANLKDNRVKMRHVTFYAANTVPFFYLPYFSKSLDSHERFFQFVPGYSSRLGAFLLTAYNYPVYGKIRGITRVDLYSKRGVGLGQDFTWKDKEETYNGIVRGYYLNDNEPFEGPDSENRNEDTIDEERYRLRLAHAQRISPRDSFIGEANYLSDPYVLQDFFNEEFRNNVQPENRATLTHRGDHYTAAIQLNKRLNDFYSNVDRLPELSFDVSRQQIKDSDFYYESDSSAAYLEKVYEEDSDDEDYSAFRIDSGHTIFYPTHHFGFLNIIPRAGYRGTYYSETQSRSTVSNDVVVTDGSGNPVTNDLGLVIITNRVSDIINDEGADMRNVFELGWEGSFKAFKTWDDFVILSDGDGIRHVAEPYLDHTYRAKPDLTPEDLPQFDSVDQVDERHDIQLGMRNKLQTRRNKTPVDIINLNLYTYYRIEKEDDDEDFSDLNMDADLNIYRWLPIELDGTYDFYESEVQTFNTQVSVLMDDKSKIGLEHRYRVDSQSLLAINAEMFPEDRWSFDAGMRYDFEDAEMEEYYGFIKHTGQCMGWGVGFQQVDEDEQVWVQIWLTEFPQSMINVGYK